MMDGPTQFRPMYWAPRGSWWAHISSRTMLWSHSDPSWPPNSSGHDSVRRPFAANSLQNRWVMRQVLGIVGKRAEETGRNAIGDQFS